MITMTIEEWHDYIFKGKGLVQRIDYDSAFTVVFDVETSKRYKATYNTMTHLMELIEWVV